MKKWGSFYPGHKPPPGKDDGKACTGWIVLNPGKEFKGNRERLLFFPAAAPEPLYIGFIDSVMGDVLAECAKRFQCTFYTNVPDRGTPRRPGRCSKSSI